MRWIPLAILIYLIVIVQVSVGRVLDLPFEATGPVGPDLLAILAVYAALRVKHGTDAMLAGCVMGLAVDLSTGTSAASPAAVGPMGLGYALAAGMIFRLREVVLQDSAITGCVLAALFCVMAHGFWVTVQCLIALQSLSWSAYGAMLIQVLLLAVYTAVLMPLGAWCLRRGDRLLITTPADSRHRR